MHAEGPNFKQEETVTPTPIPIPTPTPIPTHPTPMQEIQVAVTEMTVNPAFEATELV